MTSSNWLALFMLGVASVAIYMIATRPEPTVEDFEFLDEEWWG
jgi:hypothetical protein